MRKPSSSSKYVIAALAAATFGLTAGTALARTTHRMSQTRAKEMRVASAEHKVRNGERHQRSHVQTRNTHPANTNPPPR